MLPSANQDLTELRHERSHKLLMLRSISILDIRWETGGKGVEALELLLDIPKLRRAPPHCVPVDVLHFLVVGRLDNVEHVLGGSRSGLIKKNKQLRPRRKLNTNSQALPLLDVESLTGHSDDSIRELLHIKHVDYLLDVVQLILSWNLGGLAKKGAEFEGLADGHGVEMEILLLHVADAVLERGVGGFSVDVGVSADDAHGDSCGEDVEKSCFTSAGYTLFG
ncbi:hypothetical protein HG530_001708 [Fusarium avenaceum]|nr:hypothetical protein HG530_001708 [Fusarium avenaceum]